MNKSNNRLVELQEIRKEAKEWLCRAQQPVTDIDPPFQLMLWGLDQGITNGNPEYMGQFRSSVEYLAFQVDDQNEALRFLVEIPDGPEEVRMTAEQLARAKTPEQASLMLLDALDSAMTARVAGWPPIYPREPQG